MTYTKVYMKIKKPPIEGIVSTETSKGVRVLKIC